MTYNITLTANHQSLTAEYLPLAAESVQYLTAKVICETEDWTGREIKAMFGQGCTVYEVPVTGGEITAKQQLNLTAGDWRVWLVGNSARDGEVIPRITTNVAHISVAPTGGTEGSLFPATPPTVEEQLRADMGNLADLTTEDKSSLVAAINEVRQTGGGGVQPDWNQNDSTQPDYIKNRPFYTGDPVETVLVEESTVSFAENSGLYMGQLESTFSATVGEIYKVYWDGAAYECACVNFNGNTVIGNLSIAGAGSDTGEPFMIAISNSRGIRIGTADTSASHTISISSYAVSVVKIDQKYLPVASETEPGIISITPLSNAILQQVKNEYFSERSIQVSGYGAAATIKEYADKNNSHKIFSPGKFGGAVLSCYNYVANKYITSVLSGNKNIECWKFSQGSTTMERLWGIFEDGVVISSSTADSTKKFKITVDDSGTITATEVS